MCVCARVRVYVCVRVRACMHACMCVNHVSLFCSRGENGPCGYKVVPTADNRALFIWVLNTDLKVHIFYIHVYTAQWVRASV